MSDYDQTRRYPRYEQDQGGYAQQGGYGQQGAYGQQGGYGQPEYGAGYEGQPPRADRPPNRYGPGNNPFGAESDEQFGIVGMVLGLLGGIVLIVAFTGLDWYSNSTSFGDVGTMVDGNPNAAGFASAYFGWFAWVFAILAVIAAVTSSFPSPVVRAARVIGVVAGFAAAGLSFLAVQYTDAGSYTDYLKHARIGFYLAVAGFIVVGVGAAIGPRKV